MNKLYRILIKLFFLSLLIVATTNVNAAAVENDDGIPSVVTTNYNPGVIPPHAKIKGKTYGDWGAEWWKWALRVPISQSPIMDPNGTDGSRNQHGPIWFLAGTFGTFAERSITIPAGKFIFFPLVNGENDYPCPAPPITTPPTPPFKPDPGQTLEDFLTSGSVLYPKLYPGIAPGFDLWATDPGKTLSAKVDSVELKNLSTYRGLSKLTTFIADPTEIAIDTCITGNRQEMVSDGYWIMLAPLKSGKPHKIEFSAYDASNPSFALHVIYHVTVSE